MAKVQMMVRNTETEIIKDPDTWSDKKVCKLDILFKQGWHTKHISCMPDYIEYVLEKDDGIPVQEPTVYGMTQKEIDELKKIRDNIYSDLGFPPPTLLDAYHKGFNEGVNSKQSEMQTLMVQQYNIGFKDGQRNPGLGGMNDDIFQR